jgi:aldehyde:ferredoxin oxidoreductase
MKRRPICTCRVLHIDLDSKNSRIETFEGEFLKSLIGGRGITSYLLYRDVPKGTDPLSPDNILAFTSGALGGTNAPTAARTTVTSKSPVTKLFMKASMGGQWGAALRFAGYDVLVLHGRSDSWVNVVVTDQGVSFEPADKYLGKSVLETTELIAADHPALPDLSVCCIGIAGEKHIAYAGIFGSVYNTAARGGMGAVMGSKLVKAVCCYGRTGLSMSDADWYMAAVEEGLASVKSIGRCAYYKEYGTVGGMIGLNESGSLPVRNFQRGYMEDVHKISGQAMTNDGYLVRRDSCFACPISCKRFTKTIAAYPGTQSGGPEYETLSVFGAGCEVADMDACLRANYLVNFYGLDCISCGAAIQWAMETAE